MIWQTMRPRTQYPMFVSSRPSPPPFPPSHLGAGALWLPDPTPGPYDIAWGLALLGTLALFLTWAQR